MKLPNNIRTRKVENIINEITPMCGISMWMIVTPEQYIYIHTVWCKYIVSDRIQVHVLYLEYRTVNCLTVEAWWKQQITNIKLQIAEKRNWRPEVDCNEYS
jgi:hypothetical protein